MRSLILASLMLCAACAKPDPQLVVETKVERLSVPEQLLTCPEPPDFSGSTIRDAIAWGVEVWNVAMDCRSKLSSVRALVTPPSPAKE